MSVYQRAIIIDEPWISMILLGKAVGDEVEAHQLQRARGANQEGLRCVVGIASLVDCLPPLSLSELACHEAEHGVPSAEQRQVFDVGRRYPWVLNDARPVSRPVLANRFG
jgi:hypothetical protein